MTELRCPRCGRSLEAVASPAHAALAAEITRLVDLLDVIGLLARDAVAATSSSAVWRRESLEKVLLHIAALASVRDMGGEHA